MEKHTSSQKINRKKSLSNVISDFLNKKATWKSILILLGLTIIFNLVIFPLLQSENQDITILDSQFSYTSKEAYNILAKYNSEELKQYFIVELTVDLIYPIIYTMFFSFLIFKLSKKSYLSLLPLLILLSDYFENIGIAIIIDYYPQKMPSFVTLISSFTTLKWTLVAISILIIFALLIQKLLKRIRL